MVEKRTSKQAHVTSMSQIIKRHAIQIQGGPEYAKLVIKRSLSDATVDNRGWSTALPNVRPLLIAIRVNRELYPHRRIPDLSSFTIVGWQLAKTGIFAVFVKNTNCGPCV